MADIGIKQALDFLIKKSSSQGYVTLEDILSCGDLFYLEVDDIERLTDLVLENNIIINNNPKIDISVEKEVDRKDVSSVYDAIVAVEPALAFFIDYVRKIRPADKKEMVLLQYQLLEGNKYARQRAVEGNLRIAVVLAYRESIAFNKNIGDCISEACLALVSACDSYKPDEHQNFASYISVAIIDNLARTGSVSLFTIPANVANLYRKMCRDSKYKQLDRNEAVRYACSFYGLEEHWSEMFYNILHLVVLDESVLSCIPEKVYSESFFENFNTDVENCIERKLVQELINQSLMSCLKERERYIIENRFGLNGFDSHMLGELGSFQNVSKERIRQIEIKSLEKLKTRKDWFAKKMAMNFGEKRIE